MNRAVVAALLLVVLSGFARSTPPGPTDSDAPWHPDSLAERPVEVRLFRVEVHMVERGEVAGAQEGGSLVASSFVPVARGQYDVRSWDLAPLIREGDLVIEVVEGRTLLGATAFSSHVETGPGEPGRTLVVAGHELTVSPFGPSSGIFQGPLLGLNQTFGASPGDPARFTIDDVVEDVVWETGDNGTLGVRVDVPATLQGTLESHGVVVLDLSDRFVVQKMLRARAEPSDEEAPPFLLGV